MAEASEAGRNNAAAGVEAVGEGGRIDGAAFRRGASELKAATRAHLRAGAAFVRAARHARSSGAEWERAEGAHAMAGDAESRSMLRRQAGNTRAVADSAAGWAKRAGRDADTTKKAMRKWEEFAAAWAGGGTWGGDRAGWLEAQERIRADAERGRAEWSAKAEKARESVQEAAEHVRQYKEMAERASAMIEQSGGPQPGAQDAVGEWKAALAAARRAVAAWRTRE